MTNKKPSLPELEKCVTAHNSTAAIEEVLAILGQIDLGLGEPAGIEGAPAPEGQFVREELKRFATRFVSAFGHLISDPSLILSAVQFEQLVYFNRWLDLLFYISGFGNPAHLLPIIANGGQSGNWIFRGDRLQKFFVIFTPDIGLNFDFDQCMKGDPPASAVSFLSYLGTRYCFTERAFAFRDRLLEWLPGKLAKINLGAITLSRVAEPYMYCSYAATPKKHAMKADLVEQLRRLCLDGGCREVTTRPRSKATFKPTIVVITDNFSEGHSVYRTHSRAVKALRESFHVVGVVYPKNVQPAVEACFDEIIAIPTSEFVSDVREMAEKILAHEPEIVFHLGVGMSPHTIAIAALKLAPVQCASFGHTATTMSPAIDYMILPEDFVNSRTCYSETLLLVPPGAMPYAPRVDGDKIIARAHCRKRENLTSPNRPVHIAVLGSIMKLNWNVLNAMAKIRAATKAPITFHFFPLAAVGISYLALERRIQEYLPGAVVHKQTPHLQYFEQLAECDMFLCPFPYGNMNSIVDAFQLGLPGVCLDGAEAHAHADAAYFRRVGLPEELIANDVEHYVAAALRLIDDSQWRYGCSLHLIEKDLNKAFYVGDERLFCRVMCSLIDDVVPPSSLEGPLATVSPPPS